MKTVVSTTRRLLRLGIGAALLLLGQQALALGTDAGTVISNQASVDYDVSGVDQTDIVSSPADDPGSGLPTTFVVDRRVDFELIEVDGAHTSPVAPGQADVVAAFTLSNDGNAIMDFRLDVADFAGSVHGIGDSTDLTNYRIRVANGDGPGGVPVLGDLDYVDELAEDGVVEIYVFADAPSTVTNGQYANIQLTATAADDANAIATPGVLDGDLAESPGADDPDVIESVFADADNDGVEQAEDGYAIVSASLAITKDSAVISDPFGSGKALPGAVIEYTIVIDNTAGATAAENVVLTDNIQIPDVIFEDEAYGANQDVSIDGAFCNADPGDTTPAPDGCAYDPGTGALSIAVPDIAAGASTTVTFQVQVSTL